MSRNTVADFWAQVALALPHECWAWRGAKTTNGYGRVGLHGRYHAAHRLAYEWHRGPIPKGMELDHLCRNKACVNPSHLEPVTHQENMRRAAEHRTHCPHGHPYDAANTMKGAHGRACRKCYNRIRRQNRARKRSERGERPLLTREQHADIARRYIPGRNQWNRGNAAQLAAEYGVTRDHITQIGMEGRA